MDTDIFTYIWLNFIYFFMVNVGKYTIHGCVMGYIYIHWCLAASIHGASQNMRSHPISENFQAVHSEFLFHGQSTYPPRNKGLMSGLVKANQRLISPYWGLICHGGTLHGGPRWLAIMLGWMVVVTPNDIQFRTSSHWGSVWMDPPNTPIKQLLRYDWMSRSLGQCF